jgi:hypothetical protein
MLNDYCNIWRLKVNVEKSKIVFFSQGRTPNNLKFNFNGKQLEIVDKVTDCPFYIIKLNTIQNNVMFSSFSQTLFKTATRS